MNKLTNRPAVLGYRSESPFNYNSRAIPGLLTGHIAVTQGYDKDGHYEGNKYTLSDVEVQGLPVVSATTARTAKGRRRVSVSIVMGNLYILGMVLWFR